VAAQSSAMQLPRSRPSTRSSLRPQRRRAPRPAPVSSTVVVRHAAGGGFCERGCPDSPAAFRCVNTGLAVVSTCASDFDCQAVLQGPCVCPPTERLAAPQISARNRAHSENVRNRTKRGIAHRFPFFETTACYDRGPSGWWLLPRRSIPHPPKAAPA